MQVLSKSDETQRDEPEVAATIGTQLLHMNLESLPIALRRRIRDIGWRIEPNSVIEIGAGIGHLSSWMMDLWSEEQHPKNYFLVESGGKFGVILKRLVDRYEASDWAEVIVGDWREIISQFQSQKTSGKNTLMPSLTETLTNGVDMIIVDVGWKNHNDCIIASLPLLSECGILVCAEPEVPLETETNSEKIAQFNEWISLVKMVNSTHQMGFVPLFGGTVIGITRKYNTTL